MQKLLLIDTFGLFFRMFYAMSALRSADGKPSGMLFGMANFVLNLRKDFGADGVVFALEGGGQTKRHELLAAYKANRAAPPDELKAQIPVCIEMIKKMGFCCASEAGYEADDIIASCVRRYGSEAQICIVTTDKDLHQLVGGNVVIFNPAKKEFVGEAKTREKFGVSPAQIRDYLALCGDASDNIPGVAGIGATTAKKLLNEVGDLDFILANIALIKNARTKNLLFEGAQMARLSKDLATLCDTLRVPELAEMALPREPFAAVRELLEAYSLHSVLAKVAGGYGGWGAGFGAGGENFGGGAVGTGGANLDAGGAGGANSNLAFDAICVTDDNELLRLTDGITPDTLVAFDTETTGVEVRRDTIVGFSFCFNESRAYYVPLAHTGGESGADLDGANGANSNLTAPNGESADGADGNTAANSNLTTLDEKTHAQTAQETAPQNPQNPQNHAQTPAPKAPPKQVSRAAAHEALRRIFSGFVVGHNLKFDFDIVRFGFGLLPPANFADTMILAWLDDPAQPVGMDALAVRLFDYETIKFKDVVPKGATFAAAPLSAATRYAAEDAWVTLRFFRHFRQHLREEMWALAGEVEFKILLVLAKMQERGIAINTAKLADLIATLDGELSRLRGEIFALVGEEFNLNSTAQLAQILFEKLALKAKKRTKTGYSTDESVLRGLIDEHPAIAKILDFREIFKLQSTYTQPLLALAQADPQSRVRTTFAQTGTATGRLASRSPNLQNIPARSALGKRVRGVFSAREGCVLVSADYSQIELRLLAHFSADSALCAAFAAGADIHARTAEMIFGEVTPHSRQVAKSINFGLIYGMGAGKLGEALGISRAEAKDYIERYFAAFGSVSGFLDEARARAQEQGFSQTLLGRRRYFDFDHADEKTRAAQLREAVNTIFQGSAADIIKLAMVEAEEKFSAGWGDFGANVAGAGAGFGGDLSGNFGGKFSPRAGGARADFAQMLLQIHDELIFEVAEDFAEDFSRQIAQIMQNVVKLNVPLVANVAYAKNWDELK